MTGAILLLLAVMMGAFGAHALDGLLRELGRMDVFETANRYHFYHGLALLLLGVYGSRQSINYLRWVAGSMLAGICLFSGSLYLLAVTDVSWLGMITPFGGVLLCLAWVLFILGLYQARET